MDLYIPDKSVIMVADVVFLYDDIALFKIREKYDRGEKWVFRTADKKELPATY